MKLGIVMFAIGFLGILFMFLPAVEMGNADIYSKPWVLAIGIIFFVIFLVGLYRLRRAIRRAGEDLNRHR